MPVISSTIKQMVKFYIKRDFKQKERAAGEGINKVNTGTLGTEDSCDRGGNTTVVEEDSDNVSSNTRFRRDMTETCGNTMVTSGKKLTPIATNTTEGGHSRSESKMAVKKETAIMEKSHELIRIGKNIQK